MVDRKPALLFAHALMNPNGYRHAHTELVKEAAWGKVWRMDAVDCAVYRRHFRASAGLGKGSTERFAIEDLADFYC